MTAPLPDCGGCRPSEGHRRAVGLDARFNVSILKNAKIRKLAAESPSAFRLWVLAIIWSVDAGHDGRLPSYVVPSLGGTPDDAADLVAVGAFHRVGDEHVIHDFADVQTPAAEIAEARERDAERKRAVRHAVGTRAATQEARRVERAARERARRAAKREVGGHAVVSARTSGGYPADVGKGTGTGSTASDGRLPRPAHARARVEAPAESSPDLVVRAPDLSDLGVGARDHGSAAPLIDPSRWLYLRRWASSVGFPGKELDRLTLGWPPLSEADWSRRVRKAAEHRNRAVPW